MMIERQDHQTLQPEAVTNGEFLQAIFGTDFSTSHITGFPDDPSDIANDRRAICWGGGYASQFGISDDWNNYFTISRFDLDATGHARRRKNLFISTYVIVADDVREKLPVEQVNLLPPPSYKLLTSPGSEQWGWILNVPCTDASVVNNLLDGLVEKGLAPSGTDPGMKGVTRYVRLPKGVNSKASRVTANGGTAPRCQLLEWNPERKHTIESLAIPFAIDLTKERNDARTDGATNLPDHPILQIPGIIQVKGVLSPGRYDIRCPWTSEHTGGADDGAALFTNDDGTIGFKCHHGSCEGRNRNDLLAYIDQYNKGFREKLKLYEANIMFATMGEITVTLPPQQPQMVQSPVALPIPRVDTRNLTFLSFDEMTALQIKIQWLIKGVIDTQSLILLFGETGSMKSFLAIDIGLCVATGIDWNSHKIKQSGSVFYICGEGFAGISKRLKAWESAHHKFDAIPFYTSSTAIDLSDPEYIQQMIIIIQRMTFQHGPPALIIIDTLNRNFGGGDENSTSDMTHFIMGIDHLKNQLKAAIMVVHHTGLGDKQRSRGSSALKAAVDTEYRLDVDNDIRRLTCTKMKDHEPPEPIHFRPEVVNLGYFEGDEEDMEIATSIVLTPTFPINTQSRPKLNHSQGLVLDALRDLCGDNDAGKAHIEQWREASVLKSISDSALRESKLKAFNRCRSELIKKEYIETDADYYWVKL